MPTGSGAARAFLSGVILAAGASARMGRPKQLLPLGDRPLLQHVVDQAVASRLDEVVVVLGHRAREIRGAIRLPPGGAVRAVVNPEGAGGRSASLRRGLHSVDPRATAAAVLLGDQPHVTGQLIDRLVEAFLTGGSPAARPVYSGPGGGRTPGHPVLLARRVWPEVENLRGDRGVRDLLSSRPEWLLEVPVEGEPPADLNTWEDYERAIARGGGRGDSLRGAEVAGD
jgi:molybdenum cofactor cytidylyltransferase